MQPKNATAKDVAARAGVSRSLVSMYLSRNPNVWISEETRARLDAAIRELGYRPNRSAQILRGGKSRVIGVVLGGISGLFASCLSEALMENLEEAGYRVFLGITRYDPERERRVLESMMNFEIDALVYTGLCQRSSAALFRPDSGLSDRTERGVSFSQRPIRPE